MATATRPKPDVALMATGLRQAAKPLGGLVDVLGDVHVTGSVSMTVVDPVQAGRAHQALVEVSERVRFSGPYESGRVHITHDFGVDAFGIARLEVTVNVWPAVADQIIPMWRAAATGTVNTSGEAL